MAIRHQTFRASTAFPAEVGERFYVRDGQGRRAETWELIGLSVGKTHQWLTYRITDHGLITEADYAPAQQAA